MIMAFGQSKRHRFLVNYFAVNTDYIAKKIRKKLFSDF